MLNFEIVSTDGDLFCRFTRGVFDIIIRPFRFGGRASRTEI